MEIWDDYIRNKWPLSDLVEGKPKYLSEKTQYPFLEFRFGRAFQNGEANDHPAAVGAFQELMEPLESPGQTLEPFKGRF